MATQFSQSWADGAPGTAAILVREFGPRRAVLHAETQADHLERSGFPASAAIYRDAARLVERGFVAEDLAAAARAPLLQGACHDAC